MTKPRKTETKQKRGRPKGPRELYRFNLYLYEDQVSYLHELISARRADLENPLTLAAYVRAILDTVIRNQIDLSQANSEADVRQVIEKAFRPSAVRKRGA